MTEQVKKTPWNKKYATREEYLEAARARARNYYRKITKQEKEEDFINKGKTFKENKKDGLIITIETLDRIKLNTVILSVLVNYKFRYHVNWQNIKIPIKECITNWLNSQDNWHKKNYIFVWNNIDDTVKRQYEKGCCSFDFQVYLLRVTEPRSSWKLTYPEIFPLKEELKKVIWSVCAEEGVDISPRIRKHPENGPDILTKNSEDE